MIRIRSLLVALALLLPSLAHATWQTNGNAVCTAAGVQSAPVAMPDGAGGVLVAWVDQRPSVGGIYLQHVTFDGSAAWTIDGVLASGATPVNPPRIVSDGAGGALVIWATGSAIQAQRVDLDGSIHSGWPANGRLITSDVTSASNFGAVSDGAGGAYIMRHKFVMGPPGTFNTAYLKLTRIDADGNFVSGWTEAGINIEAADDAQLLNLATDPTGGVFTGSNHWFEAGTQPHRGTARHMNASGSGGYGFDGTLIFAGQSSHGIFHIANASDGIGGMYTTYSGVTGTGPFYFGQHMDAAGNRLWSDTFTVPFSELTVQDGTVGVWYAGRPPNTNQLVVHRRTPAGALPAGWTGTGVPISSPTTLGVVAAGPQGPTVLLCWSENTGSGFDIRAIAVAEDGTLPTGWSAGGNAVCTTTGDQTAPVLVIQPIDAIACWQDQRAGAGNQDIYAMRVEAAGAASVGPIETPVFGIAGIAPVPARDRVSVRYGRAGSEPIVLEVADVAGRTVLRREVAADRAQEDLELGGLDSGVYFVRLRQGARIATGRFAVVR